jgi:hypothetical protein
VQVGATEKISRDLFQPPIIFLTVPAKLGMKHRRQQTELLRAKKSPNLARMIKQAAVENARTNPRWKEKVWPDDGIRGPS